MTTNETTLLSEVVVRLQSGDKQAQGELIDLTQKKLFKFCLLLGNNKELAEDLCQETYIKVIQNISSLKNPDTCLGWIYQIAKNAFVDVKRKPDSKNQILDNDLKDSGSDQKMDLILSVQKVLSQFETDDRLLLLLIELEGYSYKETGDIIGSSEDAVRSKLHRLRTIFIKKMNSSETN
jgi:RNA polymerase sigma-70 factor (ECF subfamily)